MSNELREVTQDEFTADLVSSRHDIVLSTATGDSLVTDYVCKRTRAFFGRCRVTDTSTHPMTKQWFRTNLK